MQLISENVEFMAIRLLGGSAIADNDGAKVRCAHESRDAFVGGIAVLVVVSK